MLKDEALKKAQEKGETGKGAGSNPGPTGQPGMMPESVAQDKIRMAVTQAQEDAQKKMHPWEYKDDIFYFV